MPFTWRGAVRVISCMCVRACVLITSTGKWYRTLRNIMTLLLIGSQDEKKTWERWASRGSTTRTWWTRRVLLPWAPRTWAYTQLTCIEPWVKPSAVGLRNVAHLTCLESLCVIVKGHRFFSVYRHRIMWWTVDLSQPEWVLDQSATQIMISSNYMLHA